MVPGFQAGPLVAVLVAVQPPPGLVLVLHLAWRPHLQIARLVLVIPARNINVDV